MTTRAMMYQVDTLWDTPANQEAAKAEHTTLHLTIGYTEVYTAAHTQLPVLASDHLTPHPSYIIISTALTHTQTQGLVLESQCRRRGHPAAPPNNSSSKRSAST